MDKQHFDQLVKGIREMLFFVPMKRASSARGSHLALVELLHRP